MAIIAILSAIFSPAVRSSFGAAKQFSAGQAMHQLGLALQNYTADYDDTYPLGMNPSADGGIQAWFGHQGADGKIDVKQGSLSMYLGKTRPKDPTADYKDYFGDHSGYGYNWETLGSDYSQTMDFSTFPNCKNAATTTQIAHPSSTVAFATSVFLRAPWMPGGDSNAYDFGFVSPPRDWGGNPNMDFRHMGTRTIDPNTHSVSYTGNALVLWVDGSLKALKQGQVQDKMFERNAPEEGSGSTSN
jgi:type II secretory pathway pseudopilin PulG